MMPHDTPFPERWLAERKTARPDSVTLALIEHALTEIGLDEALLLDRLKALSAATSTRQAQ